LISCLFPLSWNFAFFDRPIKITSIEDRSVLKDNGISIDIMYLDFSKAFDTVPHQRLFLKLEKLGFEGSLLNGLRAF
jgi:hypothetical protein